MCMCCFDPRAEEEGGKSPSEYSPSQPNREACPTCADGDLRLFGGNASSGRLEVYSTARVMYGTVCDDNFDTNAARVACHQLGFSPIAISYVTVPNATAYGLPPDGATPDNDGIFMDGYSCQG